MRSRTPAVTAGVVGCGRNDRSAKDTNRRPSTGVTATVVLVRIAERRRADPPLLSRSGRCLRWCCQCINTEHVRIMQSNKPAQFSGQHASSGYTNLKLTWIIPSSRHRLGPSQSETVIFDKSTIWVRHHQSSISRSRPSKCPAQARSSHRLGAY